MFILIAGGEPTGAQLAFLLTAQNHRVRLIEHRPEVLVNLHKKLPTEVIFEGKATDPEVLEQAGIRQANVLVTCMPLDSENLVLCALARQNYQVDRTIARINDPNHAWLFDEKFSVDVALNESNILAHLIEEEMSLGDMMTLLKLRRGQYSLLEVRVPERAKALSAAIKDLELSPNCTLVAIIRKNEMILPRGLTKFEEGDEVLAITDQAGAEELNQLFLPENPNPPLEIEAPGK